jgi:hypothetical protein
MIIFGIILRSKIRFQKENPNLNSSAESGLSSVVRFASLGCSSRSSAEKASFLRSTGTSQGKKKSSQEKWQLFFLPCFVPSLRTLSTLLSSGLLRPQHQPARKMRVRVSSTAPCVLAVAQPPAINLNRNAFG